MILLQAVSLKIQTLKSQSAMANAMKGVTKAMGQMNKQVKFSLAMFDLREILSFPAIEYTI